MAYSIVIQTLNKTKQASIIRVHHLEFRKQCMIIHKTSNKAHGKQLDLLKTDK